MILSKTVKTSVNVKNIKYLESLGYTNLKYKNDIIIPIEHLSKGSGLKIDIKCDICSEKKIVSYERYNKNIENYGFYSCSKCKYVKIKLTKKEKYGDENYNNPKKFIETNLERYGVEFPQQSEKIRNTTAKNNLEKFGVENTMQNEIVKNKAKNTCLKLYGVKNPMQNEEIKNKGKQTRLEIYGDENYNNKEQAIQTNLERYGVEHPLSSKEIQEKGIQTKIEKYGDPYYNNLEKFKETCLKLYGVKNPFQSEEIKEKCRQTMFENYGVTHNMQSPEIIKKAFESRYGITHNEYLETLPDFKLYKNIVWKFTRKQPLKSLKNIEKRKRDEYWLEHKFSIKEGFLNNICPFIIGNIINLEMLYWKDNLSKNYKCSITKEELFNLYDNKLLLKED